MNLGSALEALASVPQLGDFSRFAKEGAPERIEEALKATGTATVRRRRLPAEQVPWLVIDMAFFSEPTDHRGRQQAEPSPAELHVPHGGVAQRGALANPARSSRASGPAPPRSSPTSTPHRPPVPRRLSHRVRPRQRRAHPR